MPKRQFADVGLLVALLLYAALLPPPAVGQTLPPVVVTSVERQALVREVALTGSLVSPRRARLAPEVAGTVATIAAETGDTVTVGDRLLRLDTRLGEIEHQQTEAARREAEASLANARRRLGEAQELAQSNSIGQSELETRRAEVRRLEAVLARRRAEQSYQAELLARHTLNAPFAGVVNRRLIDLGERAMPETPAFELVAIERLWLDLEVPQRYFGEVQAGTPVRIRFDARPDELVETRVATVVPVSDNNSRTFLARIELDNADTDLMPGMSARATLRIDTGRSGVVIPKDALIRYPDGRTVVWVTDGGGERATVRERRVRTGLAFEGRIAIREGLEAGTAVVTAGNEALQDGQQVRVTRTQ